MQEVVFTDISCVIFTKLLEFHKSPARDVPINLSANQFITSFTSVAYRHVQSAHTPPPHLPQLHRLPAVSFPTVESSLFYHNTRHGLRKWSRHAETKRRDHFVSSNHQKETSPRRTIT